MSPLVVPTGTSPTISDFISRVRADLFDSGQRVGDEQRWSDSDLVRALDRSNDRYSAVGPNLKQIVMPTFPYMRIYALPADAWFTDAAEYPYGQWPKWWQPTIDGVSALVQSPPAGAGAVSFVPDGNLSAGTYGWQITNVVPGGGETLPVALCSGVASLNEAANLSIPQGPYGVSDRRIYRTQAGGSTFTLAGAVGDNVVTNYIDSGSDAAIASAPAAPIVNTTQGIRQFELQISDDKLPNSDNAAGLDPNYGWIGLRYGAKHELDSQGTTIPERHWDVLCIGAEMYAAMAYLTPTADNFHYVDGQFRDQVDDTKAPIAWLAIADSLSVTFQARLAEVKNEDNAGVAAIGSWGDKPERWDRL